MWDLPSSVPELLSSVLCPWSSCVEPAVLCPWTYCEGLAVLCLCLRIIQQQMWIFCLKFLQKHRLPLMRHHALCGLELREKQDSSRDLRAMPANISQHIVSVWTGGSGVSHSLFRLLCLEHNSCTGRKTKAEGGAVLSRILTGLWLQSLAWSFTQSEQQVELFTENWEISFW